MTGRGSRFIRNPKECTIASRRSCCAHFRSRATNFSREFVSSFELAYVTTAFKGTIRLTARSFLRDEVEGSLSLLSPPPPPGHSESVIHDARAIKPGVHPIKISGQWVGKMRLASTAFYFRSRVAQFAGHYSGLIPRTRWKCRSHHRARIVIY